MRRQKCIERICLICGKSFKAQQNRIKKGWSKYCSKQCFYAGSKKFGTFKGKNNPNWKGGKIKKICKICGKEFFVKRNRIIQQYCSRKCMGIEKTDKNNPKWTQIKRKCLRCGKIFYVIPSQIEKGRGRFCSQDCWWESRKVKRKCLLCGKIFYVPRCQTKGNRGQFCSQHCKGLYHKGLFPRAYTSIEQKVASWLTEFNIPYTQQALIKDIGRVDFLLKNRTVIETDGNYWHSFPNAKTRDARRDFLLGFNGFRVLRLSETNINNHPQKCKNLIRREYETKRIEDKGSNFKLLKS